MDIKEILKRVDHTLLKQVCTFEEIKKLCDEGIEYNVASVCIPPSYVKRAKEYVKENLKICTVIGFPNGYSTKETKIFECKDAIKNGADEIDMVVNLGDIKSGEFKAVEEEIKEIKEICGDHILKVIVETCFLTEEEKIKLCEVVTNAKADYIKTSTGFGTNGATKEDIILFSKHIGPNVKIKASGGVKNLKIAEEFIKLGADRLGTSSIISIIKKAD
ncbi:MAG: deoxyribose-phosphate aldolase [Clostridium sp.]|nr:deoxyribose-phosphate aldolase [Clostridium sp.]